MKNETVQYKFEQHRDHQDAIDLHKNDAFLLSSLKSVNASCGNCIHLKRLPHQMNKCTKKNKFINLYNLCLSHSSQSQESSKELNNV